MKHPLLDSIDSLIAEKNMLKHPFYQAWNEGKLTKEMLKDYACQYYHFVKEFPRMVSAVHSNTPALSAREPLLLNLMDEELGAENHPELWMRFANALGATRQEVEATIPLPTTSGLVHTMMSFCKNSTFQEGLASLYAYESQVPEVSRTKIEGLKNFYGISDPEVVKFFSVHQEADVHHSRSERDMIGVNTPEQLYSSVELAAKETATALWEFLDGVHETHVVSRGLVC